MKVRIGEDLLEQIETHALSGYPLEVCGFLVGSIDLAADRFEILQTRPATNGRVDAAHHRYLIGPAEYRAAEREATDAGAQVVGIYHSHPDAPAEPSTFDLAHAWPNQVYVIVSVVNGAVQGAEAWLLAQDRRSFNRVDISDQARGDRQARKE